MNFPESLQSVICMKKVIQGQCLVQLMTIKDTMPDPSPVMLGEMNLYLEPLILLQNILKQNVGKKSLLSYIVGYLSEIFIDLWYDYIIDKPYAIVNQNNLTFKNLKFFNNFHFICKIYQIDYCDGCKLILGDFEPYKIKRLAYTFISHLMFF